MSFVHFVTETLKEPLSVGQTALARIAFDREPFSALTSEERAIATTMFNCGEDGLEIPPNAYSTVTMVCGRSGGKTRLLGLRALHLALTGPIDLRPGEHAYVACCGSDMRYARQILRAMAALANTHAGLRRIVKNETSESLVLQRPDGITVEAVALPASDGGRQLRGRTFLAVAIDEADFCRSEIDDLLSATSRLAGQRLVASTPWLRGGQLHKLFEKNFGRPSTSLAIHATTEALRGTDPQVQEMLAREYARDPSSFRREFEAVWLSNDEAFFDADAIDRAIDYDRPTRLPYTAGHPSAVGHDFAWSKDGTACVATHGRPGGIVDVCRTESMRPRPGQPLLPSATYARAIEVAREFHCRASWGDGYALGPVREALAAGGIATHVVGMNAKSKTEIFQHLKELLHGGKLKLPPGDLADELRHVTAVAKAGGGLDISSPRRQGSHGDLVSALAASCWGLKHGASAWAPASFTFGGSERSGFSHAATGSFSRPGSVAYRSSGPNGPPGEPLGPSVFSLGRGNRGGRGW